MTDAINESIIITKDGVQLIQTVAGVQKEPKTISLEEFYKEFSNHASVDTGILPLDGSGTLAIRSALGYTQTAFQYVPGIYPVNWGQWERDADAQTYWLAQPYRIVISDYLNNTLLGSKTFYATSPILTGNEQMYHINVPNTNCKGYGDGNALGWLCLYHKTHDYAPTFRAKFNNALERSSGVETYNDSNMSETDGTRFYEHTYHTKHPLDYNDYAFLWNPSLWQKKSQAEGFEWTMNPSLWLPVLCDSIDEQTSHVDDGLPLTFNRALYGHYAAYYDDRVGGADSTYTSKSGEYVGRPIQKPFNIITRKDTPLDTEKIFSHIKSSTMPQGKTLFGNFDVLDFSNGDPFSNPIDGVVVCSSCNKEVLKAEIVNHLSATVGIVCRSCYDDRYNKCGYCGEPALKTSMVNKNQFNDVCETCAPKIDECSICHDMNVIETNLHLVDDTLQCFTCAPLYPCPACSHEHPSKDAIFETETSTFCVDCGVVMNCTLCDKAADINNMNKWIKGTNYATCPSYQDDDEIFSCQTCIPKLKLCSCFTLQLAELVTDKDNTPDVTECPNCKVTESFSLLDLLVLTKGNTLAMENQLELTEETVDPSVQNYIMLNNLPLFFPGKKEHVKEIAEHHGFSHFYILAGDTYFDPDDKKTYDAGIRMFMVINNTLGMCINPVENPKAETPVVDQGIQLKLPKIPRQMIATIDALFREVDRRNGTETIAILTYDISKTGPEGWGYIIPKQTNSAAHCKYEPESVIELMPNDTTIQVGTAHSHPDMPSYKSGTDQTDQLAAGDGIHMTLGWQKHVNNNATDFYIEVQFGSLQQRVNEAYVFEDYNYTIDENEIESHLDKIEKEAWASSSSSYTPSSGGGSWYGSPAPYSYTGQAAKTQLINLPDDAPDPKEAIIVLPTYPNPSNSKYHCAGCDSELVSMELKKRSCLVCKMPVSIDGEDLLQIIEARKLNKTSYAELDISKKPTLPIYIWDKVPNDNGGELIDIVYEMYTPDGDAGK